MTRTRRTPSMWLIAAALVAGGCSEMPEMPDISMPDISMPDLSMPDWEAPEAPSLHEVGRMLHWPGIEEDRGVPEPDRNAPLGVPIATDPSGAVCEADGREYHFTFTAPLRLELSAAAAPVRVSCLADGFRDTEILLDTGEDGTSWRPVFLTRRWYAGTTYLPTHGAGPDTIEIVLEPELFKSERARDAWYAALIDQVETERESTVTGLMDRCRADGNVDCARLEALTRPRWDAVVRRLEIRRSRARVAATG